MEVGRVGGSGIERQRIVDEFQKLRAHQREAVPAPPPVDRSGDARTVLASRAAGGELEQIQVQLRETVEARGGPPGSEKAWRSAKSTISALCPRSRIPIRLATLR
jgi:hypothetical protein